MVDRDPYGNRRTAWGARILAPLAFFAAATVLVLLIQNALNAEGAGSDETTTVVAPAETGAGTTTEAAETTTEAARPTRRFYRVRPGDTLLVIADRFNTTVENLVSLNPQIDPQLLVVGQRIRVR